MRKGSFTGATEKKIGKFEAADHGTIFLDEIGEMNVGTQAKLLRMLEGHPYERVGGNVPIRVDVRVVAATNQPLEQQFEGRHFPPRFVLSACKWWNFACRRCASAERRADFGRSLLEAFRARDGPQDPRLHAAGACRSWRTYHWPGNVRELRNVVERAVALGTGPMLDAPDIWLSSLEAGRPPLPLGGEPVYEPIPLEEIEKQHILRTLEHTDWNKSQAAAILNIERSTLDRKIKNYDLKR